MAMSEFFLMKGDRLPPIEAEIRDGKNTIIDLSAGGTTAKFIYKPVGSSESAIVRDAEIVNPGTDGNVRYNWTADDAAEFEPGSYAAQWLIEFADGRKLRVPNAGYIVIRVSEALS